MSLPTAAELDAYGGPDGRCALEHFLGRTLAEAEAMFLRRPYLYFEDLLWMGPAAFHFYFPAAVRALLGGAATGDGYALASFASTLEHQLVHRAEELRAVAGPLAAACGELLARWESFEADPVIYGDLPGRYAALRNALSAKAVA